MHMITRMSGYAAESDNITGGSRQIVLGCFNVKIDKISNTISLSALSTNFELDISNGRTFTYNIFS